MRQKPFSHDLPTVYLIAMALILGWIAEATAGGWGEIRGRLVNSGDDTAGITNAFVFLHQPVAVHPSLGRPASRARTIEETFQENNGFSLKELEARTRRTSRTVTVGELDFPDATLTLNSPSTPLAPIVLAPHQPLPLVNVSDTSHALHVFNLGSRDEWITLFPGEGVVRSPVSSGMAYVVCGIHPEEVYDIEVINHPYICVTDRKGEFAISKVPSGICQIMCRKGFDYISLRDGKRTRRGRPVMFTVEAGRTFDMGAIRVANH